MLVTTVKLARAVEAIFSSKWITHPKLTHARNIHTL